GLCPRRVFLGPTCQRWAGRFEPAGARGPGVVAPPWAWTADVVVPVRTPVDGRAPGRRRVAHAPAGDPAAPADVPPPGRDSSPPDLVQRSQSLAASVAMVHGARLRP